MLWGRMRSFEVCTTFSLLKKSAAHHADGSPADTYQDRHKMALGSSLFGTNEIFAPLQELKEEVTSLHGEM